jgi:xylulokinase
LGTTKGDLAEAILEGICFEMRDILDMKESLAGTIHTIRLGGGVAKSQMWCQMFADVLGKPVEVTEVQEMGCLGAAMCAAIGAGIFKDPVEAIEKCVRVKKTYVPNVHKREAYEEAFSRWQYAYGVCNDYIYR